MISRRKLIGLSFSSLQCLFLIYHYQLSIHSISCCFNNLIDKLNLVKSGKIHETIAILEAWYFVFYILQISNTTAKVMQLISTKATTDIRKKYKANRLTLLFIYIVTMLASKKKVCCSWGDRHFKLNKLPTAYLGSHLLFGIDECQRIQYAGRNSVITLLNKHLPIWHHSDSPLLCIKSKNFICYWQEHLTSTVIQQASSTGAVRQ